MLEQEEALTSAPTKEELSIVCKCPDCEDNIRHEWGKFGQLWIGCNSCCWHRQIPNPLQNKIKDLEQRLAEAEKVLRIYADNPDKDLLIGGCAREYFKNKESSCKN